MRFKKFHLRQIGPSKETQKRLLILLIVFLVAFVFFAIIINHKKHYSSKEMAQATLPTISSQAYGSKINELHGYVQEMDACYMRDSIIPLTSKRKLTLDIDTAGMDIESISYEVRSTDTSRKISERSIDDFRVDKQGHINLNLKLENLIKQGEEYLFVITLKNSDNQDIYYYTRVLIPTENCYEKKCFNFVSYFHETALSDNYTELATYVETDENSNTDTLSEVNLTSSLRQIGFDGFDGTVLSDPVVEIKDISPNYTVIEYRYKLKLAEDTGDSLYNVTEYYKVREGIEHTYVLDYRRTMEEILDTDNLNIQDNKLCIGVAKEDVNYLSNETGTIVAFVQAGTLYEYNQDSQTIHEVFTFTRDSEDDSRADYDQHNIKLLSMDENGNLDFAVYGYMNRGSHEGYCGIDLFRYDSEDDKAIERAFVATTYSYQILNASFSDLLYITGDNEFYVLVNGDLLSINLKNMDTSKVLTQLSDTQVTASKSGRYVAYALEEHGADKITVLDLETNKEYDIKAPSGKKVIPLAFMEEDLVYGTMASKNIDTSLSGTTVYPIDTIYIRDTSSKDGEIYKKYHEKGYYIESVSLNGYTLTLDRIIKSSEGYIAADSDTIKNSAGQKNKAVNFLKEADTSKGENTIIQTADVKDDINIKNISSSLSGFSPAKAKKTITVDTKDCQQEYYVYMGSSVLLASTDVVKAISLADEEMGIVVDSSAHYIWRRGKKTYCNSLKKVKPNSADSSSNSISKSLSAILSYAGESVEVNGLVASGKSPIKILNDTLKDDIVLDLTGLSLSQTLYYVSSGYPVYARSGNESALVIVGYDAVSITVYNPSTGAYNKMGLTEASKQFEDNGNIFITYVSPETDDDKD